MDNLAQLSAVALRRLARKAAAIAADLEKSQPSERLALEAGVQDVSYDTVRYGRVLSYRGSAVVTMADGSRWQCIGHGPRGTSEIIYKEGYVEFVPLPVEQQA